MKRFFKPVSGISFIKYLYYTRKFQMKIETISRKNMSKHLITSLNMFWDEKVLIFI